MHFYINRLICDVFSIIKVIRMFIEESLCVKYKKQRKDLKDQE